MRAVWRTLARKHVLRRICIERLTEPLHLNLLSLVVGLAGTYRAKIAFDLVVRQQHAFGLLSAAEHAARSGVKAITVVELGVGSGAGLCNLAHIAGKLTRITGVGFNILGFDSGAGMPAPRDHRDHPELYAQGNFPMDRQKLEQSLPKNARLILGPLEQTIPDLLPTLDPQRPVGFVSLDVDYYCSSCAALRLFDADPACYLPQLALYVDDIHEDSHNPWCGELLAIRQFNESHELRKIAPDGFLRHHRIFKHAEWIDHMFKLHVLDHPRRNLLRRDQHAQPMLNPYL